MYNGHGQLSMNEEFSYWDLHLTTRYNCFTASKILLVQSSFKNIYTVLLSREAYLAILH